jgi:hypothetical protein
MFCREFVFYLCHLYLLTWRILVSKAMTISEMFASLKNNTADATNEAGTACPTQKLCSPQFIWVV